jgi:ATP/maltotriose-dependent transcriptional regulator MalT
MIANALHTSAAEVLRRCQMPAQEIRWVLTADEPAVVHMLLELHVERLREELADRLAALSELESQLAGAALIQRPA